MGSSKKEGWQPIETIVNRFASTRHATVDSFGATVGGEIDRWPRATVLPSAMYWEELGPRRSLQPLPMRWR
jgi:hypothetical protein